MARQRTPLIKPVLTPSAIRNQRGFTFVEVVVSALILTTVAVGLLRVAVSAHQSAPAQLDRSGAENIARTQAEALYESVRQDWWPGANQPLSVSTSQGAAQSVVVNGKTYSRSYTVSTVNLSGDGGGQDYRKVDVVVQ